MIINRLLLIKIIHSLVCQCNCTSDPLAAPSQTRQFIVMMIDNLNLNVDSDIDIYLSINTKQQQIILTIIQRS